MLRLAMVQVGDRAVAEEIVQEAWLPVLRGPLVAEDLDPPHRQQHGKDPGSP
jgi:DNA-directed RNA polymerase specialized sigma24 family protein